jgi:zinc transporter ZupT
MLAKKNFKKNFLPIGLILLLLSLISNQFLPGTGFTFASGLLMGISVPMMLSGLYFSGKLNRESVVRGK